MLCLLLKFAFQPVNLNESTSTKRYHQTLPLNASSKRKHKTQALMGATRLASEKMQLLFSRGRFTLLSLSRRETRRPH